MAHVPSRALAAACLQFGSHSLRKRGDVVGLVACVVVAVVLYGAVHGDVFASAYEGKDIGFLAELALGVLEVGFMAGGWAAESGA